MESKNGNYMRQKIISNLFSSGVEKLFIVGIQFLSSIILIRLLPRDDYGVIGIVVGYFVFINLINISLENIILRDHKKFDENLSDVMSSFFVFNIYKSLLFIVIAFILSFVLSSYYDNSNFIYAIWSLTFIMIASSITAPFTIYFASKFNQKLVTKISIIRSLMAFILLFGLFISPTLYYIALKDFIVSIVFISIWIYLAYKKLDFKISFKKPDFNFLLKTFLTYSLWTHLSGSISNFIYKSDTLFLSFFIGFAVIGDYNISLNSANIANILPMIIGYQNSIALSNCNNEEEQSKVVKSFLVLSVLTSFITLFFYYFLGELYLKLITGQENNESIYFYMMCIVLSLTLIKSIGNNIDSTIRMLSNNQKYFFSVFVPIFIFTIIIYFYSSYFYGAKGIAISNVIVAVLWIILLILHLYKIRLLKLYIKGVK